MRQHVRDRKLVKIRHGRATVSGEPLFVTDHDREDAQHDGEDPRSQDIGADG